jgi:hypothetical protein
MTQAVGARDLLRAQVLFDSDREVGAALHGGIVGDDDALPPRHPTDAGNDTAAGDIPAIHAVSGKLG